MHGILWEWGHLVTVRGVEMAERGRKAERWRIQTLPDGVETRRFKLTVAAPDLEALDALAKREAISLAEYVRRMIREEVERGKGRAGGTSSVTPVNPP